MAQSTASRRAAFLQMTVAALAVATASGVAAAQTIIDMPPPPRPKAETTTYESFQANGAATAPANEAEAEAPEIDRTAGRAALDSYAFARRSPRVLRPFQHMLPPGVAQTWPGPSGITVFPSWRWGGWGWGGHGWGWSSTWGWGSDWGWPGWGWGWGGVGIGVGHVGGGSAPMFKPSSFRFTPGR